MKKVQRLIVLILALAMCFSLAACGSSGTQQPAQDNSQTEQPTENKDTPAGEIVINFPCRLQGRLSCKDGRGLQRRECRLHQGRH